MTRKEMTNERAQSDVRINSAEQGGIGRSQIESLFKTHLHADVSSGTHVALRRSGEQGCSE